MEIASVKEALNLHDRYKAITPFTLGLCVKDFVNKGVVGEISSLSTNAKGNLVAAINEVNNNLGNLSTNLGRYATVWLSSDYTVKTTSAIEKLPLTKVQTSYGGALSVTNDGGLKIGSGVKSILVVGQVYYYTGTVGQKVVHILRNTEAISRHNEQQVANYTHLMAGSKMLNVSAGDVIYLAFQGTAGDIVNNYAHGTFMSIYVLR